MARGVLRALIACSRLAAAAATIAALLGAIALGDDRVALVIGNQHYGVFGDLSTPLNDAADIASDLRSAGFVVVTATDLDERAFAKSLSDFATRAEGADVAVFYYGGHGLQFENENYLMPVDATLENRFSLLHETVQLSEVVSAVSRAHTALIYIDACRTFPVVGTFFANPNERITRVNGPAPVTPSPDVFIGFSASPGQTARDGVGRNSPFAAAMLKYIPTPGLSFADLFSHVAEEVKTQTNGAQRPQGYGTTVPDASLVSAVPTDSTIVAPGVEERAYQAALTVGTSGAFRAYLEQYPNGYYAALALEQLSKTVDPTDGQPPPALTAPTSGQGDPVAACDALASDPTDPKHLGAGVAFERIEVARAVPACLAATNVEPSEPRLRYQYGRALMASKQSAAALVEFKSAAAEGYAEAMTSVARSLRDGDATARDVPAAIALMKKAAAAGSSNAMASLGVIYAKGAVSGRDDDLAFQWYRRAADLNNPLGLNNLASMYRDGRGVPRDPAKAAELYEKAVDVGYPAAMYNLARLLDTGKGVSRDTQREAALLLRAMTLDADLYDALVSSRDELSEDAVRALQGILQQRGRYIGSLDGKLGKDTRAAIAAEIGR